MTILTMIFVTLKLCSVIAWSWFFVLLPLQIEIVLRVGWECLPIGWKRWVVKQ